MRREIAAIVIVVGLMTMRTSDADAANDNPFRKATRGLTNVFTGWLEVPFQITQTTETEGSFSGSTVGFVKGMLFGIGRTGVGILETVTFLLPNHVSGTGVNEEAYGPIVHPEFVVFRNPDADYAD